MLGRCSGEPNSGPATGDPNDRHPTRSSLSRVQGLLRPCERNSVSLFQTSRGKIKRRVPQGADEKARTTGYHKEGKMIKELPPSPHMHTQAHTDDSNRYLPKLTPHKMPRCTARPRPFPSPIGPTEAEALRFQDLRHGRSGVPRRRPGNRDLASDQGAISRERFPKHDGGDPQAGSKVKLVPAEAPIDHPTVALRGHSVDPARGRRTRAP